VITYHAGQSFSASPGDRHVVSENASPTEKMHMLAVFVVNTADTKLATPFSK
jgi:quercetin dioxygenase-like cupin family protein